MRDKHRVLYYNLLTKGNLNGTLAEADERANRIFQQMVKLLTEQDGITEQLKATNPIAWVQKMNNIHNCAMEITSQEVMCI